MKAVVILKKRMNATLDTKVLLQPWKDLIV